MSIDISAEKFHHESSIQKSQVPSRWSRVNESLLMTLIGEIRRPLGPMLRRLLYPTILGRTGKSLYIQTGVELLGASCIEIGNNVKLLRDVRLNA